MGDVASPAPLSAPYPGNVAAFLGMTYNWTKRAIDLQASAVNIQKCVSGKRLCEKHHLIEKVLNCFWLLHRQLIFFFFFFWKLKTDHISINNISYHCINNNCVFEKHFKVS